jgi:hypothetical protein
MQAGDFRRQKSEMIAKPHMGLNGATPADRAGIKVEGENKWLTIIQKASMVK